MAKLKIIKGGMYGSTSPTDKYFYNDYDGFVKKYGDLSTIKDIKVKSIAVNYDATRMRGANFTYLITKNDNTTETFEGVNNQEGGAGSSFEYINIPDNDRLIKIKGGYGDLIDWIGFVFEKQPASKLLGNTAGGTAFEIENPILFFTQIHWTSKARAIGSYFYSPDIRDINRLEADKLTAEASLKKWTDIFGTKTAEQVKAELDGLNKRPNTTQEEYNKLLNDYGDNIISLNIWRQTFPNLGALVVKAKYDEPKEIHTDYDLIKNNLDNWTKTFPSLDFLAVKAEYDKPKETHGDDLPADWKAQLATIPTLTANQKPSDYDTIKSKLGEWQTNFPNQEPSKFKEEITQLGRYYEEWKKVNDYWEKELKGEFDNHHIYLKGIEAIKPKLEELKTQIKEKDGELTKLKEQQGNQSTQGTQYLNKLLAIYKAEVKKRTELFYQGLSLDNNMVNARYGNANVSYLELLNNPVSLTADSEPKQIINAFKLVALTIASERAKELSDEMASRPNFPAPLKKNRLEKFRKIKEEWDLILEIPKPENNPLYLPVIIINLETIKKDYRTILTKWQII